MAKIPGGFNTQGKEEMSDFTILPEGPYTVKIVESEYKKNSKENGHILMLKRVVTSGQYKGRFIFRNLNLDNPNEKAVEISQKEFTSTCKACGKAAIEDSSELHNIEHTIHLKIKKGKKKDDPSTNDIAKIEPLAGASVPPSNLSADTEVDETQQAPKKKKPIFDED